MFRPHRSTLLSIAAAATLIACSDAANSPTAIAGGAATPPVAASRTALVGTIVLDTMNRSAGVYLQVEDGNLVWLAGDETASLQALGGARVLVRGTYDIADGMAIDSFRVLAVDGRDVLDGVVVEMDGGYGLQLTADASIIALTDPPAELIDLLGQRVWLADTTEELPVAFGIIGPGHRASTP
jgi:hypothetical protein